MISLPPHGLAKVLMKLAAGVSLFATASIFAQGTNALDAPAMLPESIKRVTALPLACDESDTSLADGCDMLNPILQTELAKTKAFELVSVSPDRLRSYTGKSCWTGTETLPAKFFDSLVQAQGCDAVLFCQLTSYKPYVPLAIGWRLKLVDVHTQKILWEVDQVFDASDPTVAKNAQQFEKMQKNVSGTPKSFAKQAWSLLNRETPSDLDDQWDILNSPRYFGQYAAVASLESLPKR